ncbi:hypothetical protein APHAL10511_007580 [Amanita phalloides]|nr:hypothetical protein APHAL10511_007580 [Amanita phalloides]
MVHINGVLLVLSSVILAGISAPAVHEHQVDRVSESHPVVEHVVLEGQHVQEEGSALKEKLQHVEEEEDSALEERQHVQEDASLKGINAKMEAEYKAEASHLQVGQSAKALAQEAKDISAVSKSGAAAVDRVQNYLQTIAREAAILDRSVGAATKRLTVPQALSIQRQFAGLTTSLAQGTRVIRAARPLTSFESRQLLAAIRAFENDFLNLLATTTAKKATFTRLPYNIIPYIKTALKSLGSMTDGFEVALMGVVAPNAAQTVDTCRRTLARAFARASMIYAL